MKNRKEVYAKAISICKENWRTSQQVGPRKGPWGQKLDSLFQDASKVYGFPIPDKDVFPDQYYWDSAAALVGYLASADALLVERAFATVESFCFLVEQIGFVPNASNSALASRSQPPFLAYMANSLIRHGYEKRGYGRQDKVPTQGEFLERIVAACQSEIATWNKHRLNNSLYQWYDVTPLDSSIDGILNLFRGESRSDARVIKGILATAGVTRELVGHSDSDTIAQELGRILQEWSDDLRLELATWLKSRRVICATGQDFSACYGEQSLSSKLREKLGSAFNQGDLIFSLILDILPTDLNCLLYRYFGDYAKLLGYLDRNQAAADALDQQKHLGDAIFNKLWHGSGYKNVTLDGTAVTKFLHLSDCLYPLWSGLCEQYPTTKDITLNHIKELTTNFGVAISLENTGYQWDYNLWPLQNILTVEALRNVDQGAAKAVNDGYLRLVEECFFRDRPTIFEKYNPHNGSTDTVGRYIAAPDFTWGAAAYLYCHRVAEDL
jgi:neutral trehalase